MDHPVWVSLDDLLEKDSGEFIANKYIGDKDDELTPFEFLAACSSQAAHIKTWSKRVELMKAVHVAIKRGGKRVHGFAESIFKELSRIEPHDEAALITLLEILTRIVRSYDSEVGTPILLRCLYDPILTRILNTREAQRLGKDIISIIEKEYETFTLQELLLFQAFREKENLEESNDSDDSLSDWENTSDSTDSSLRDQDRECPSEVSAACAWILAPLMIDDPPILTAFGRFAWGHHHARFLMSLPSNTLASRRGLELFASFGNVNFPPLKPPFDENNEIFSDAYETISTALNFVSSIQSIEGRNAITDFLESISPDQIRIEFMLALAKSAQNLPPIRGYVIDLLRKQVSSDPKLISQIAKILFNLLKVDNQEFEVISSILVFFRLVVLSLNSNERKPKNYFREFFMEFRFDLIEEIKRLRNKYEELEADSNNQETFFLRQPYVKLGDGLKIEFSSEPPKGVSTPQADLGRARLIVSSCNTFLQDSKKIEELLKIG